MSFPKIRGSPWAVPEWGRMVVHIWGPSICLLGCSTRGSQMGSPQIGFTRLVPQMAPRTRPPMGFTQRGPLSVGPKWSTKCGPRRVVLQKRSPRGAILVVPQGGPTSGVLQGGSPRGSRREIQRVVPQGGSHRRVPRGSPSRSSNVGPPRGVHNGEAP